MAYSLNSKLKYLRINRGLTQTGLGNFLNMTRQGYAHYENGTRSPDHQTILKLANFYEVNVNELIDNREIPLEIAYLYETSPYVTDKKYKNTGDDSKITVKITNEEKNLISLYRKLDINTKDILMDQLNRILKRANKNKIEKETKKINRNKEK